MDKELRTTFEVDSLGGICGGYPLIGAMSAHDETAKQ